jgi:hypothetical protein
MNSPREFGAERERDELTKSGELTLPPSSPTHRRRHPRLATSHNAGGAAASEELTHLTWGSRRSAEERERM